MLQGFKVVTPTQMFAMEKGGNSLKYMQIAGEKIGEKTLHFLQKKKLEKKVTLLVGKGNNGGDALCAGLYLLNKNVAVKAYCLEGKKSSLNEKFLKEFQKKGGAFTDQLEGVLLDGLFGIGLSKELKKDLISLIEKINGSKCPILSIDIPSGLDGEKGNVRPIAVRANQTFTLGAYKIGLLIEKGPEHCGDIELIDFGLPKEALAAEEAICYVPKTLELPPLSSSRYKYQAGYVLGIAGSTCFIGAAKLAGFACLKAGAGIVRLFSLETIVDAPFELILERWNAKSCLKEMKRANALFIGPGLGKHASKFKRFIEKISIPCVFDASALIKGQKYPKDAILTPHRKEAISLLGLKKEISDKVLFANISRFCQKNKIHFVLKGAVSFIFSYAHKPMALPFINPGMATAGTGDVLTGIIAAFLAQKCSPYEAAVLGVSIHGIAGRLAAEKLTVYCMSASDLFSFMPAAFEQIAQGRDILETTQ